MLGSNLFAGVHEAIAVEVNPGVEHAVRARRHRHGEGLPRHYRRVKGHTVFVIDQASCIGIVVAVGAHVGLTVRLKVHTGAQVGITHVENNVAGAVIGQRSCVLRRRLGRGGVGQIPIVVADGGDQMVFHLAAGRFARGCRGLSRLCAKAEAREDRIGHGHGNRYCKDIVTGGGQMQLGHGPGATQAATAYICIGNWVQPIGLEVDPGVEIARCAGRHRHEEGGLRL